MTECRKIVWFDVKTTFILGCISPECAAILFLTEFVALFITFNIANESNAVTPEVDIVALANLNCEV